MSANGTKDTLPGLLAEQLRIADAYQPYRRNLRIMDPCCGDGAFLRAIAAALTIKRRVKIATYGMEPDPELARQAEANLTYPVNGSIFQSYISNREFNLLYLNPPKDAPDRKEQRHQWLTQCTRYLMDQGVLIYHADPELLRGQLKQLSAAYDNIHLYSIPGRLKSRGPQDQRIILLGVRDSRPERNPGIQAEIAREIRDKLSCPEQIKPIDQANPAKIPCPTSYQKNISFNSRQRDPELLLREAKDRGVWNAPDLAERLWPAESRTNRPLLPLKKGHMGLLIATGFMDNLCIRSGEQQVLVKGQTTKRMELETEEGNQEIWRETLRVKITAVDLDTGQFINIRT